MYRFGHYGMVLLLYSFVGYVLLSRQHDNRAVVGTILVVLLTMLPDWDSYVAWLPHRGPTHTVWFALLVGLIVGTIAMLVSFRRHPDLRAAKSLGRWSGGLATFSVLTHLLADMLNPMGIQPLYPILDFRVTLDLVSAGDPVANFGLLLVGTIGITTSRHLAGSRAVHEVPPLSDVLRQLYRDVRSANPEQG